LLVLTEKAEVEQVDIKSMIEDIVSDDRLITCKQSECKNIE